jgi:glutamate dehydrogenase
LRSSLLRCTNLSARALPTIFPLGATVFSRGLANSADDAQHLIYAAFSGDFKKVKQLAEVDGVSLNATDYDNRSAMHLAAATGNLEILEYLLTNGGDYSCTDRFGHSPLAEAVRSRHTDCVRLLVNHGASFNDMTGYSTKIGATLINYFCSAATNGDVESMDRLVIAGLDVNAKTPELRTPLHHAAAAGQIAAVEWLVANGAVVDCLDRYHITPLAECRRHRGRAFKGIETILLENGASDPQALGAFHNPTMLQPAMQSSYHSILTLSGFEYIESIFVHPDTIVTDNNHEYSIGGHQFKESFGHLPKANRFLNFSFGNESLLSDHNSDLGRAITGMKPVRSEINVVEFRKRFSLIESMGIQSHLYVPITDGKKVYAVLRLLSTQDIKFDEAQLESLQQFAFGIISAEVCDYSDNPIPPSFPTSNMYDQSNQAHQTFLTAKAEQMAEVYRYVLDAHVFSPAQVYQNVYHWYNLGFSTHYFRRDSRIIANHLHSFMASKRLAATQGHPEEMWLQIENNEEILGTGGGEQAFYVISNELNKCMAAERRMQARLANLSTETSFSVDKYTSKISPTTSGSVRGSTARVVMYVLQSEEVVLREGQDSIWEYAPSSFLQSTNADVRGRYDEVVRDCLARLAPVARVFPVEEKTGDTPIMFAFKGSAPTLSQLTQLMASLGLTSNRLFHQYFANNVHVYSLYLQDPSPQSTRDLAHQFTMLSLVPTSPLTTSFLKGAASANEYAFLTSAARFAYYFMSTRTDEYDVLSEHFKNDPLNMGRLRTLNTNLKREAVSLERIYDCILDHPQIANLIYQEFKASAQSDAKHDLSATLLARLNTLPSNGTDANILSAMAFLVTHLLKTNFFVRKKSAISFRLDPTFMSRRDWPQIPFGLFFVLNADFQGFHLRFEDISRGGIRMIRSRDVQAYQNNLSALLNENFGLAFTQNKKNKDIPEFGSKGTVLLHADRQSNAFHAFQCYITSLLDLILPERDANIVDKYNKPEFLFMGPDEGTADMMEWACRHAQERGYPFWRSFTTGKPLSLGGVPHDMFGMTTRSVHRYVLGALAKAGLDEKDVTKVQTGGPDGDLGCNEILISKDRTVCIIDGSGVLFDPAGLNREELTRLAHARVMIEQFDESLLGEGGFRVLCGDTNVSLPTGELVENGVDFRNTFHLHPLCKADLFVPCGGRPEAVKLADVDKLFLEDGTPKFKYIVEGANLFFSNDARMVLEQRGVVLYKDASTNKGGVTCSSCEVFAALALEDEQFAQNMAVADVKNIPAFYNSYVQSVINRIESDATHEFECIHAEHLRTGLPRYILTDHVSDNINNLVREINESSLYDDVELRDKVLTRAISPTLLEVQPLSQVLKRVPDAYLRAIFSTHIASRYVYANGTQSNEFKFYHFMSQLKDS